MMRVVSMCGLSAAFLLAPLVRLHAEPDFGQIAMHVAYILKNYHLTRRELDDEMSKELLEGYLDHLDFSHACFTQQDVDGFRARHAATLGERTLKRDISPALEIFDIYKQRVKERVAFVRKRVAANPYTFDSDRTQELKRGNLPWPEDQTAADKLWDILIEGELLTERLADHTQKESVDVKGSASAASDQAPPGKRVLMRYERLLEQLEKNDKEDIATMFLSCLAHSYDSNSEYMSKPESEHFKVQAGKDPVVGIGLLVSSKDGVAEITGIVTGGPADKEGGLKLNDKVAAIAQGPDGEWVDVRFRKLQEVVDQMRGKAGSIVRLKVNRSEAGGPAVTQEISVVRQAVALKEKLANAELIEAPQENGRSSRLGWVNLPSFYIDVETGKVSASMDVSRLLKRLLKENIEGLVIDLRGNGGGSVDEVIKLTGLFIPTGPVLQARDSKGKITWRDAENASPLYQGPMIVLTDGSSASASEILAAALQDYRRAIIVGEKSTFGNGVVQTFLPVERYLPFFADKTRAGDLKLTIQKFYRITGDSTQLRGVIPDLRLPSIRDVLNVGERALANPLPYDTIPARPYTPWSKTPLPANRLSGLMEARLAANPEFQYILEDSRRLKERINRNAVSLNETQRIQEIADNRQRLEERRKAREERCKETAASAKGTYRTYRLTLDNVDQPSLAEASALTKEQVTGMRVADNASEGGSARDDSQHPHGIEPVKLETLHILSDWIGLSAQLRQAPTNEPGK